MNVIVILQIDSLAALINDANITSCNSDDNFYWNMKCFPTLEGTSCDWI